MDLFKEFKRFKYRFIIIINEADWGDVEADYDLYVKSIKSHVYQVINWSRK